MTDADRAAWATRQELASLTYEESQRHLRDLARLTDGIETGDPDQTRATATRILAALPPDPNAAAHRATSVYERTHRPRRHGKPTP